MDKLSRRCSGLVHLALVVLSALISVALTSGAAAADLPHILVILVDDLGYGDLSAYGAEDLRSPNIDQLIARGMRFDEFYANCPVCSPTRASLLSGRYPELVGVPGVIRTHAENSWGYLDPDAVLLPQRLKRAGYHTALVGKWHLGLDELHHPNQRGFDFFHGFLGDMMDDYYHHRRHDVNYMRRDAEPIEPDGHATDLFSRWACDYLRSRQSRAEPFFLYLAYNAPHTPIQPPDESLRRVMERQPSIDPKRAKLVALIEHLDEGIGRVISCLDECGFDQNTFIVFSSDNGGQLNVGADNGDLRDGKQSMYEGGLKVPTCAVWPGKIQAGSQTSRIGLTMDLFSTICELVDIEVDPTVDGISLLPTMLGKPQETSDRDLFFHRREGGDRYGGLVINAVRRGRWKLLQNSPFAPLELYDLANDPQEQTDLASDETVVFRQLSTALRVQLQRGGAVPWQPPQRRDHGVTP